MFYNKPITRLTTDANEQTSASRIYFYEQKTKFMEFSSLKIKTLIKKLFSLNYQ